MKSSYIYIYLFIYLEGAIYIIRAFILASFIKNMHFALLKHTLFTLHNYFYNNPTSHSLFFITSIIVIYITHFYIILATHPTKANGNTNRRLKNPNRPLIQKPWPPQQPKLKIKNQIATIAKIQH